MPRVFWEMKRDTSLRDPVIPSSRNTPCERDVWRGKPCASSPGRAGTAQLARERGWTCGAKTCRRDRRHGTPGGGCRVGAEALCAWLVFGPNVGDNETVRGGLGHSKLFVSSRSRHGLLEATGSSNRRVYGPQPDAGFGESGSGLGLPSTRTQRGASSPGIRARPPCGLHQRQPWSPPHPQRPNPGPPMASCGLFGPRFAALGKTTPRAV